MSIYIRHLRITQERVKVTLILEYIFNKVKVIQKAKSDKFDHKFMPGNSVSASPM